MLAEVRGQGVGGLELGAVVDLVDRHVNDQVELVRRALDLNDFELGAPHHADVDVVHVTHVSLFAVRHDADQLVRPSGKQRAEQLDEHGLLDAGCRQMISQMPTRHRWPRCCLQGVVDHDSHVLPDDRVVEAAELGNLAGVIGQLDRPHDLPKR